MTSTMTIKQQEKSDNNNKQPSLLATQARKTEYDINPLILNRWSTRAMTGEELANKELMSLFEAARWAPSSNNNQPWRFIIYVRIPAVLNVYFEAFSLESVPSR